MLIRFNVIIRLGLLAVFLACQGCSKTDKSNNLPTEKRSSFFQNRDKNSKKVISIGSPDRQLEEYSSLAEEKAIKDKLLAQGIEKNSPAGIEIKNAPHSEESYKSTGKVFKVALLVPMSGTYESIGQSITEVIIWAVINKKMKNIVFIPIDTKDTADMQTDGPVKAAKLAVSIGANAVIGPVFGEAVKATKGILNEAGIPTITLSNDPTTSSKGIYTFGIPQRALLSTILSYTKELGLMNYGFLLPSDKSGYLMNQAIEIIVKSEQINKMATEFYPSDPNLLPASARRLMFHYKQTFKVNERGEVETLDRATKFKESSKDKVQAFKSYSETIEREMEAIFISAKGSTLQRLVRGLSDAGSMDKNIMLLSVDPFLSSKLSSPYLANNMLIASIGNNSSNEMKSVFTKIFGYPPSNIAMLSYDAAVLLYYASTKSSNSIFATIESINGFSGICGEFRLTSSGLVQRKYGVYKMTKGTMEMIYKSPIFL